jgi:hypothetical protein
VTAPGGGGGPTATVPPSGGCAAASVAGALCQLARLTARDLCAPEVLRQKLQQTIRRLAHQATVALQKLRAPGTPRDVGARLLARAKRRLQAILSKTNAAARRPRGALSPSCEAQIDEIVHAAQAAIEVFPPAAR